MTAVNDHLLNIRTAYANALAALDAYAQHAPADYATKAKMLSESVRGAEIKAHALPAHVHKVICASAQEFIAEHFAGVQIGPDMSVGRMGTRAANDLSVIESVLIYGPESAASCLPIKLHENASLHETAADVFDSYGTSLNESQAEAIADGTPANAILLATRMIARHPQLVWCSMPSEVNADFAMGPQPPMQVCFSRTWETDYIATPDPFSDIYGSERPASFWGFDDDSAAELRAFNQSDVTLSEPSWVAPAKEQKKHSMGMG